MIARSSVVRSSRSFDRALKALALLALAILASGAWSWSTAPPRSGTRAPHTAMAAEGIDGAGLQQAATGLEVYMASPWLRWTITPDTQVSGELRRDGELLASASGQSDDEGALTLGFFGISGPANIRGGDEISLSVGEGEIALRWVAPELLADVDATDDRIVGRAPAGASLTASLWRASGLPGSGPSATPALTRSLTAAADGSVSLSLASEGIAPGDSGRLTWRDGEGNRFHASFTALMLDIRPGTTFASAAATRGLTLTLALEAEAGTVLSTTQQVGMGFPSDGPPATSTSLTLVDESFSPHTFDTGDRLRFGRRGGLLGAQEHRFSVPPMAIELLSRDGRVSGNGPVSTTLEIVLRGPLGEAIETEVVTDASGRFDTELDTELGPGWRATLIHREGVFRVIRFGAVPQVQVFVHTSSLRGVNTPLAPVSATLRSAGAVVGTWSTTSSSDGSWFLQLGDPPEGPQANPPHRVRPGDVLEVDLAGGDPVTLVVPPMSARSDPDAETVSGEAPAGTQLQLTVEGGLEADDDFGPALPRPAADGPLAVLEVTTGADGRYSAQLDQETDPQGQALDLEPPMFGSLIITRDDGHQFRLRWAPLSVQVRLDGGFLTGSGPGGRGVRAELRAADGTLVARHPDDLPFFDPGSESPIWYALLQDELGQSVTVREGDQLSVQVGDDSLSLEVPALQGVVHVQDDLVSGRGLAGAPLRLQTFSFRGEQHQQELVIPEDGTFRFDLGAQEIDVQYNWTIETAMDLGRHSVARAIRAPGLTLDLDQGALFGSAEAGKSVSLSLQRDGRRRWSEEFRAPDTGFFELNMRDGSGRAVIPEAGDELVLEVPEATTSDREVRMRVPELVIEPRRGERSLSGRTAPDGRLEIYAGSVYPSGDPRQEAGEVVVTVEADGRWTGEVQNPEFVTRAGTSFYASLQLASGHQVYRSHTMPVLNVQYGGAAVCGYAPPRADVLLRAPGGAEARGSAEDNGAFALTLNDLAGALRATRPGEVVRGDLGGEVVELQLPEEPVTVSVDWQRWVVSGTGPAGAPAAISLPGRRCQPSDDPVGGFGGPTLTTQVGPDGTFSTEIPTYFRDFLGEENRGVEVAFVTEAGHRYFVYQLPLRAIVHVGTPKVVGAATPGQRVQLQLEDPSGTVLGTAEVLANPFGTFEAALHDDQGDPLKIDGDTRLRLSQGAGEVVLEITPLAFDFSTNGGLAGTAEPGQLVQIELRLRPSPERFREAVYVQRTADENGRFEITAVPPRSDWSFEDVTQLRLIVGLAGGHQLVSELLLTPPEEPDGPARLYLPLGWR